MHEETATAQVVSSTIRPLHLFLVTALIFAAAASLMTSNEPFQEKIVRVEAERALPSMESLLDSESPEVNLLFLNYASDDRLWMGAALAILQHGEVARGVLLEFGMLEEFQEVLIRYGSDAVLPVHYFHANDIATLRARTWIGDRVDDLKAMFSDAAGGPKQELTPYRRGLFAIALLAEHGHGLLDQFTVDSGGNVIWLQGERMVAVVGDFFTSGLRDLESQWRRGESVGVGDLGWAGLDLLVMAGSVKLLRAGKAAGMGRTGRAVGQGRAASSARFASLPTAAKISAVLGVGYVALRHPSLISSAGATLADWLGWPVWLGQFVVWFLLLLPALYLLRFLVVWLLLPCYRLTQPAVRFCVNAVSGRNDGTRSAA